MRVRTITFCVGIVLGCLGQYTARAELPVQVHFLAVENGDAAWIALADGSVALIDCGSADSSKQLLLQLQTARISTIDLLAPSRSTADALGGCSDVVRYLNVRSVLWAQPATLDAAGRKFDAALTAAGVTRLNAVAGWTQDFGGSRLTLFNPGSVPIGNAADDSEVLLLEYGRSRVLFAGAIHQQGETQALYTAGLNAYPVTVLRVADHGVAATTSQAFLDAVFVPPSARLAVVSYSPAANAPHPDAEVLKRLAPPGSSVSLLSTAQDGAITVTLGYDGSAFPSVERQEGLS